jgi:hypothetical protein
LFFLPDGGRFVSVAFSLHECPSDAR